MNSEMGVSFYLNGIVLPIIGCAGMFGNIASISHFSKCTSRRQNFQSYMLCLGIVDLFIIMMSLTVYSGGEYIQNYIKNVDESFQDLIKNSQEVEIGSPNHVYSKGVLQNLETSDRFHSLQMQLEFYLHPFFAMLKTGNIYLHLAISVERYNVVCRPFLAMRCKNYQARLVIAMIVMLAILYNIPTIFEHRLIYEVDVRSNAKNMTGLVLEPLTFYIADICPTELRQNKFYHHVMTSLALIFMFLIPYVSVLVLNGLIIKSLIANNEWTSLGNIPNSTRNSRTSTLNDKQNSKLLKECRPQVHHHVDKRRRNEVFLAKLSLLIMIPYLLYHTVNVVPNMQELATVSLRYIITESLSIQQKI